MSDIKKVLIDFMENIRDYVRESGRNLAHDDRESEEFVDIFIKYNPELFKTKRQPLADGTLLMTDSELEEFRIMIDVSVLISVIKKGSYIWAKAQDSEAYKPYQITINSYKAIAYLLDRFELEV